MSGLEPRELAPPGRMRTSHISVNSRTTHCIKACRGTRFAPIGQNLLISLEVRERSQFIHRTFMWGQHTLHLSSIGFAVFELTGPESLHSLVAPSGNRVYQV